MLPLSDALQSAEIVLRDAGVATARLDAELLLAHIIGCPRMALRWKCSAGIGGVEAKKFWHAVRRRAGREPLQYIVGEVQFYGLSIAVDRRVFIARNETEEFVNALISRLGSAPIRSILDLGTGSGALALALAKNFSQAEVLAVDASGDAIDVASQNAKRNSIENVTFVRSNWFERIVGKFDLVVSNPPYLTAEEFENSQEEIKFFEPREALVAEMNGLSDIFEIIRNCGQFLCNGGTLAIETGDSQHAAIANFAKTYFEKFESAADLSGRDRFVFLRKCT
ncbi:MAG: peptide chain release factor N(5)-glutamine methyltransferase [Puniceicoccales bacterium]|jgi:release factor glutamine methyltransferase|nr:peptide chain release factor N(5)-glutamine methyltransferase [Puniceicoccales bacterium]